MYILIVLTYLFGFLAAISALLLGASFIRGDHQKYPVLSRIQGMKLPLTVLTCILLIISYVFYATNTSKDLIQEEHENKLRDSLDDLNKSLDNLDKSLIFLKETVDGHREDVKGALKTSKEAVANAQDTFERYGENLGETSKDFEKRLKKTIDEIEKWTRYGNNVEEKEPLKPNNTSDLIRQHSDLHQEDNRKIEPIIDRYSFISENPVDGLSCLHEIDTEEDVDLEDPTTKTVHFTPASQRRLCPTHIGSGDREFKGHGPVVKVSARLKLVGDNRLAVEIHLHAKETRMDWTEAEGSWTFPVYNAPSGWWIDCVETDVYSEANYTDTDSSPDRPRPVGDLVDSFITMGDSRGNDVGNCTKDDVYVTVNFNQVTVRLKEK